MRSGLLTMICTAIAAFGALAQERTEQVNYELIRETINFLASDKAVSQDTNFRISCETLDYDCFKQQLSSKPIAGIERWYNRWHSVAVSDEATPETLRNRIFSDIFERPGKGYRKQLAAYAGYVSSVEHLLNPPADVPMADTAEDTTLALSDNPTEVYADNPEQLIDPNDNPEKDDTMIAYLAIVIGIIALALAALPFFRKKNQPQSTDYAGLEELQVRLDGLALRIKRLDDKITDAQMGDAIASLTQIMESVERRVVELENGIK